MDLRTGSHWLEVQSRSGRALPPAGVQLCARRPAARPPRARHHRRAITLAAPADPCARAGNTGLALALVAARRGYRLTVVVPDKMSDEKISSLRSMGAEVRARACACVRVCACVWVCV